MTLIIKKDILVASEGVAYIRYPAVLGNRATNIYAVMHCLRSLFNFPPRSP